MLKQHHRVAGFVVSVYELDAGEEITFHFAGAGPQNGFAFHAIQAIGSHRVFRPDGSESPVLAEGQTNFDRPAVTMAGAYRNVAQSDGCRHVCVSSQELGGKFLSRTIKADAGESFGIPRGAIFALGKGSVECSGREFGAFKVIEAGSGDFIATAGDRVHGIVAWK